MRVLFIALLIAGVAIATDPAKPTFDQSFTVSEVDTVLEAQGAYSTTDDAVCCSEESNCVVESEYQAGMNYIDAVNQRTRFDLNDGSGQSIVFFGNKVQMNMLVVNNTCQNYCPTQGETVGGFGIDPNATFLGTQPCLDGKTCDVWMWSDKFIGITMDYTHFFVESGTNPAVPVAQNFFMTPFGEPLGSQNSTWTDFKGGVPPASHFDIQGVSTCPESNQCNQNTRLMSFVRNGHIKTYNFYKYGPNAVPQKKM